MKFETAQIHFLGDVFAAELALQRLLGSLLGTRRSAIGQFNSYFYEIFTLYIVR